MIELALVMVAGEMAMDEHRREQDKLWNERFAAACPTMRTIMLEVRKEMRAREEKEKAERVIERRHQELIRAQEKIAEAIRFSAILYS